MKELPMKITEYGQLLLRDMKLGDMWMKCDGMRFTFTSPTKIEFLLEGNTVVEMEWWMTIKDGDCMTLMTLFELRMPVNMSNS